MKLRLLSVLLAVSVLLCGCGIIERSYSSVEVHSEAYWENTAEDTLRAENYQDLVNALMLLVTAHTDDGAVRVYGLDADEWDGMAASACSEVQQTDVGSYLLKYMTYQLDEDKDCYVLRAHFSYRRSLEEFGALVNAVSSEVVPELLRDAVRDGAPALTVRLAYSPESEEALLDAIESVRRELGVEEEWAVSFHPGIEDGGIVEIVLI